MTATVDIALNAVPGSGVYSNAFRGLAIAAFVRERGFAEVADALAIGADLAEIDGHKDEPAAAAAVAAVSASKRGDQLLARALAALAAQLLLAHASPPN